MFPLNSSDRTSRIAVGESELKLSPFLHCRSKVVKYAPDLRPVTEELDESAQRMAMIEKGSRIFRAVLEARDAHEL